MSETPKCPYCGAEMDLYLNVDSNDKWNARYTCAECYSFGPPIIDCEEKSYAEEVALAYTLHRAEPENRPLTLEEILAKANEEDWNFVWLEHKEFRLPMQLCPWYRERDKMIFCGLPFDVQIAENIVEIRKTWRCWPRKPTPEQMAAAEWEE